MFGKNERILSTTWVCFLKKKSLLLAMLQGLTSPHRMKTSSTLTVSVCPQIGSVDVFPQACESDIISASMSYRKVDGLCIVLVSRRRTIWLMVMS